VRLTWFATRRFIGCLNRFSCPLDAILRHLFKSFFQTILARVTKSTNV
jgi:hypothetical protein